MAVLGSMLIEKEAVDKAVDILQEKDFYQESHRKIFHVVLDLDRRGQGIDLITVGEDLRKLKWLEDVGGTAALSELIHKVSTAAHVEYYAKLVKEKAILRELINTATAVVTACYTEAKEATQLLDEAQANILKVAEKQQLHGVVQAGSLVHEVIEQIEAAHKNKNAVIGVASGLNQLDRLTTGFQKSDLILIAARPSQGKTALALNIAANVVLAPKPKPVLFFSMEMSNNAIMQRLISSEARVNLKDTRTGFFRRERWTDLTNSAARFSEAPLYIVDTPGLSVLTVRSLSRQLASELKGKGKELGLIIIDYLQLMRGSASRSENRQQEVSEISRGLKFLARDLNLPVIALSQLSRRVEEKGRADGKPQLSDLRESGALEQDADLVAFIYREATYKPNDPTLDNKAEIIIAKHRQGPTGSAHVAFIRDYTRFENETMEAEPAEMQDTQSQFT